MTTKTHHPKSHTVASPVTLPLVAFEDGRGGLTVHFQANPENRNESLVGFKLGQAGFVDTFEEFLNVDAFEPQQEYVAPEPVTVATITVHPDGVEKIEASAEHLNDEGVEQLKASAINTVLF